MDAHLTRSTIGIALILGWCLAGALTLAATTRGALATGAVEKALDDGERVAQWQEDLAFLSSELPQLHKNLYYDIAEEDFQKMVKSLDEEIIRLNDAEVMLRMMEIVAAVNDGHTTLSPDVQRFHAFPMQFYWFADGIHVVGAAGDLVEHIGSEVTHVGTLKINEAVSRLSRFISHDNESGLKNKIPSFLQFSNAFGLIGALDKTSDHPFTTTFTLKRDGRSRRVVVEGIPVAQLRSMNWSGVERTKPLCEQKMQLDQWNDWLAESRTLYFKYNRCRDANAFSDLVVGTRGFLQGTKADRFVLDLRHNGGGNSRIFLPLHLYLSTHPTLNAEGRLYVILGRHTFSSALLNALEMRTTKATFVGEPTGGRPNHYGEVRTFRLPNSGLNVTYSTKFFTMVVDGDPDALEPDIHAEPTYDQWASGHDPVLEAVFEHSKAALGN